ncbi:hypothetical protein V6C53_09595 [Desulfocurvibacter africanus]|uniref:Uncharacterized protein n=2 Tax=Desulfocurvibacter africanus TaxID=873 RepID=F3YZ06_DESAF|nr:hypothetical protein [Desulfocurvibacter africanus]EGJ49651.1 hypothetical protein Desaf_1312 [Desulfocurvibacter africanus subsp. africanus str. Walvis Bay]EMG37538.1 hypothetical protein PCS_01675 [Desulfocurvibacter africanus PCS]
MSHDTYDEELQDLVRNALAPLEKYFTTFIDLGFEDQEPRKVFIDDIGNTGMALVSHAQEEIAQALELLLDRVGRVVVKRAGMENRLGVRPRKILDVDLAGGEIKQQGWAKQ